MDTNAELETDWPNLAMTKYEITSRYTSEYNCLAWAVGEDDCWWSPLPEEDYYWPEGVPREHTLQAFVKAYQIYGYEICDSSELEIGFEKIAIYVKVSEEPQHVARQLPSGMWTSKLGRYEDIEHELDGLVGELYGSVRQCMKRALKIK
ncbi:hypothetical protein V2H45_12740 [Tumidithrix elongata RA019]|uniref:DUF7689 domain-containing protein n=1 Tax=Tumidithrix elongata BACA0141 TaxID=2716417 RepID=A0AAW9PRZ3_9CYAN|nr:hypothetical protein [Tumidithrix elongata RA019]